MVRALLSLFLVSASSPSWAAPLIEEHTHIMDASIAYLSMIFGVVNGVLNGGGSQIAGQLSSRLSTILLVSAGMLWTYTTFIGILNTASEGQFLGQKWSSMWVPVRTVIGFVLLMPKGTTGYSLIQVIVMSIVVQGVHAANFAWRTTLDYLKEGGTIVETVRWRGPKKENQTPTDSQEVSEQAYSNLIQKAGDVLKSEVCMMTLYYALEEQSRATTSIRMPPLDFATTLNLEGKLAINDRRNIYFPSVWRPGCCGVLEWNTKAVQGSTNQNTPSKLSATAIQLMVLNLLQPARHIAKKIVSHIPKDSKKEGEREDISSSVDKLLFTQEVELTLFKTAEAVMGLLKAESRDQEAVKKALKGAGFEDKIKHMKEAGWIVAGNYYSILAKTNRAVMGIAPDSSWFSDSIKIKEFDHEKVLKLLPTQHQKNNLNVFIETECQAFIDKEIFAKSYYDTPWITHKPALGNIDISISSDPFQESSQSFQKSMRAVLDKEKDPIIALSTIGSKLLKEMEQRWNKLNQKGMSVLSGAVMAIWMTLNFTIGSVLAYYIPLIPFLLFFFGSLTWLSLVVGAILAAPLVALGMMHPEGHDFFGQAEQATKLLAALFLRPMLMVFGLVFGMILCTVVFELFHYGYSMMMSEIYQSSGILSGVSQVAITTLYTTAAVSIVTRCFSLIYELPNRTFSWIGWQTEGHSEAEILSQSRSSLDQQVGGIAQRGAQGFGGSPSGGATSRSEPNIRIEGSE